VALDCACRVTAGRGSQRLHRTQSLLSLPTLTREWKTWSRSPSDSREMIECRALSRVSVRCVARPSALLCSICRLKELARSVAVAAW
jgi:hypothetical protein